MRLDEQQLATIRNQAAQLIPRHISHELRVFGSRLDDRVRGGVRL